MVPKKLDQTSVRNQVVTVRLDPKLKYFAELAARKQRRTLSSYIEWAIEQSLASIKLEEGNSRDNSEAVSLSSASYLWDVDESDRLAKLGLHFPNLLTHEEQIIWKLVRECGLLWKGSYKGTQNQWTWEVKESGLIWARLREHWATFKKVASGELPASELPTWPETDPDAVPF